MARMDATLDQSGLLRMLVYGPPKSRKTWWALRLAEAGFNVVLFDLDDGAAIAKNLTPEALRRIYRIDLTPNAASYSTSGAAALAYAMSGQPVFFDEESRTYVPHQKMEPEKEYTKIDLTKLGPRDVMIVDTWSAFVQQMTANTVSILNPIAVPKLEWDDYAKVRLILDHFLTGALRLNCHLIIIGHSETYAKKKPDADQKAALKDQIESVRLQPSSVTRAHAETMAAKFNDVVYFEIPNAMMGTMINTKGSEEFDAGSRMVPPMLKKFDDLPVTDFMPKGYVEAVKSNSEFETPGIEIDTGANFAAKRGAQPASTINVGAKPTTLNLKGNSK